MRVYALMFLLSLSLFSMFGQTPPPPPGYANLVALFQDWREFQRPPMADDIPDYSRLAMAAQYEQLPSYRAQLAAIDTASWPVSARVDYLLLWAEMNGCEFDHRVLRPWERMPGFYAHVWLDQSDVPAHEGPVAYGALEVWQYSFPLDETAQARMTAELRKTPKILDRARTNLTGNAKDLWQGGIYRMHWQVSDIEGLITLLPDGSEAEKAAVEALKATQEFIGWLESEAPGKTDPSGIGVENYDWYLRHVHLVSHTWQDEVDHMQDELARSLASLKLEEHRNRDLPPLLLPKTAEEYDRMHHDAVSAFIAFLDTQQIVTVKEYMDPALRAQVGSFSASGTPPHFFAEVDYREPLTMRAHGYHWIELARMREEPHPSPFRRGPLPYNMFQYRSEGIATGMEEFLMHAGIFDDSPRSRELIWMLVTMRASRALGGLYVHANEYDVQTAADAAVEWVPYGWFRKGGPLVLGEQYLYLSQPGYGSTYLMGKLQLERLMAERAKQLGDAFTVKRFFDEFTASGIIPISLIRWEMTGDDGEIRKLTTE